MNVSLTPEQEQLVQQKVKSGKYHSASDVVSEGLWLLEERDRIYQERLAELQKEITIGIEASERGEVSDGETVIQKLIEKYKQQSPESEQ